MSVPNTNTFTLQNVVDEIDPDDTDLVGCFDDATAGDFDIKFSGSKDELLNFRNYGGTPIPWTAFTCSSLVTNIGASPCGIPQSRTRYHNGDGTLPVVGDIIATNSSGDQFSRLGTGLTSFFDGTVEKKLATGGSFPNVGTVIGISLCS